MAERALTDVELERWLAGDFSAERIAQLEASATAADRARLDELRAENAAFLGSVDVAAEVRAIGKKLAALEPAPKRPWWQWAFAGGTLLAAAAAVLVFVRRPAPADEDDIGIKGDGVTLIVHADDGRALATGAAIAPGTRIRFEVGAARRGFITVIGYDARGATTVYVPYGGSEATAFDPASGGLLPGAIAVDATPGSETYYALYSERPFSVEQVAPAVQRGGGFPPGIAHADVVLKKK